MVEFRFDIRPLFPQPIIKVTSNLLPHTFRGDRRQALDTTSKISEIIDRLGQLSANAQKLTKPVTTAQRLRMSSNQTIYLLADVDAGKNGAVVGLLKVGTKDLYLFDEVGQTRKVENAACILDFYIHESRQRSGLGKELFETMLEHERWLPVKCSVDRPSEKLLGFLGKHYGLVRTIPQANNFVLYEGFFDAGGAANEHKMRQHTNGGGMYVTNRISPNTQLLGAHYLGDDAYTRRQRQLGSHNNINTNINGQITQISPVGRYGARRPTGSMAEKTTSEASLTPSQYAAAEAAKARKNPLDALSRMSLRQRNLEKRSGLQDVDEEFIKSNIFAKSPHNRHSGLNDMNSYNMAPHTKPAAGQPSGLTHNINQSQMNASMQPQAPMVSGGDAGNMQQPQFVPAHHSVPQQQVPQMQGGQMRDAQQVPVASGMQAQQPNMGVPQQQQQVPQQQQQQVPQQQQQQMPMQQQQQVPIQQQQQQQPQQMPPQHQQQQQQLQQQQQPAAGQHGGHGQQQIIHNNDTGPRKSSSFTNSAALPAAATTTTNEMSMSATTEAIEKLTHDMQSMHTTTDTELQPELQHEIETETPATPLHIETIDEAAVAAAAAAELRARAAAAEAYIEEQQHLQQQFQQHEQAINDNIINNRKPLPTFHLSKQHTGMKNISFGVGMAVTPTNKMEFDQEAREEFGIVKINRPIGKLKSPPPPQDPDTMSTVSSAEGLTEQGYYDLKFYHNKLW